MTIEGQLVRHLREASFADLSPAAIDSARREILWTIGTSVAGAASPGSDAVIAFARQMGGCAESTVLGFGDRLPASLAGLVNGVLAKALEYEDKFWLDNFHAYSIGTAVVPAALAVAEHVGQVSGKELLAAVALATDLQARMVKSATGCVATGWNATYCFSSLGAAMVAIRLLKLDQEQAMNAMGLAYAQVTGNYQGHQEGVLGVRMMMGFGVRNGIVAAQLGRLGVTGVHHFLTGKFGLYPLLYGDIKVNLDWLTQGLGKLYLSEKLGFKAYPCCAVIHPVLDALFGLGSNMPAADQVESVLVLGSPRMKIAAEPVEVRKRPTNEIDSQFSIPWAIACGLIDRKISLSHFSQQALGSEPHLDLAARVTIDMNPERSGTSAEIRLKDGRIITTASVTVPKGHGDNPLTIDELVDRYRDCMSHGLKQLDPARTEAAKDLVLRLQDVADIKQLMTLLV